MRKGFRFGQCRVCGDTYNINIDGTFRLPHGPRSARCKGWEMTAVNHPQKRGPQDPPSGKAAAYGKV